jgi:hypothetical protein
MLALPKIRSPSSAARKVLPDAHRLSASNESISIRVIMEAMQVIIDIPEDLAQLLLSSSSGHTTANQNPPSLGQTALEALALESLRTGKISVSQGRRLLGIASSYEMDGFLKSHGLMLPLTLEDIQRDAETALRYKSA